jgi:hypothetical protein
MKMKILYSKKGAAEFCSKGALLRNFMNNPVL